MNIWETPAKQQICIWFITADLSDLNRMLTEQVRRLPDAMDYEVPYTAADLMERLHRKSRESFRGFCPMFLNGVKKIITIGTESACYCVMFSAKLKGVIIHLFKDGTVKSHKSFQSFTFLIILGLWLSLTACENQPENISEQEFSEATGKSAVLEHITSDLTGLAELRNAMEPSGAIAGIWIPGLFIPCPQKL